MSASRGFLIGSLVFTFACSPPRIDLSEPGAADGGLARANGVDSGCAPVEHQASNPHDSLADLLADLEASDFEGGTITSIDDLVPDDYTLAVEGALEQGGEGYPADPSSPESTPDYCALGEPLSSEQPCNRIDDDCDGTVDEFRGGDCFDGCDPGITGTLLCDYIAKERVCRCSYTAKCGNGLVDPAEECDVGLGGGKRRDTVGQLDAYCTQRCVWDTKFHQCGFPALDADTGEWEVFYVDRYQAGVTSVTVATCDSGLTCSRRSNTCIPVIGDFYFQCPRLSARTEVTAKDGAVTFSEQDYTVVEVPVGDTVECMVACQADRDCPLDMNTCYMGFCTQVGGAP